MSTIAPVSDLRNYGSILEKVKNGSPVFLTKNGRDVYSIRSIDDERKIQEAEAMIELLCELNAGVQSSDKDGWISEEDFKNHFNNMKELQ